MCFVIFLFEKSTFSFFIEAAFFTDVRFGRLSNFSLFNYIYCSSSGYQNSLSSCNLYDSSCGYRCTQNYGIACYGEESSEHTRWN